MKFFGQSDGSAPYKRRLSVKIMSLFIFLFVSVGGVSAANPPVTIHLKNVTVAELLRQIEAHLEKVAELAAQADVSGEELCEMLRALREENEP